MDKPHKTHFNTRALFTSIDKNKLVLNRICSISTRLRAEIVYIFFADFSHFVMPVNNYKSLYLKPLKVEVYHYVLRC